MRASPAAPKQKLHGQAPRFTAQPRGGQGWRVTLELATCYRGSGAKTQGPGGCSGSGERRGRAPNQPGKGTWHNRRIKAVQLRLAEPAQLSSLRSLLPD